MERRRRVLRGRGGGRSPGEEERGVPGRSPRGGRERRGLFFVNPEVKNVDAPPTSQHAQQALPALA